MEACWEVAGRGRTLPLIWISPCDVTWSPTSPVVVEQQAEGQEEQGCGPMCMAALGVEAAPEWEVQMEAGLTCGDGAAGRRSNSLYFTFGGFWRCTQCA